MKKPRAWQRMLSGRRLDLLNPLPIDVEIEDIAHGLAFVARWNGQTIGDHPYSVAEHSLLVEEIFSRENSTTDPRWNLAALLHDAAEYVVGDMISPVKHALGMDYCLMEVRIMEAVHMRFGLPVELPPRVRQAIKSADRASAWLEATQIAGFDLNEATRLFNCPKDKSTSATKIVPLPAHEAREAFIQQFDILNKRITAS